MNHPIQTCLSCNRSFFQLMFVFVVFAIIGGCATGATREGMVPTSLDTAKKHPKTVCVNVTGGKETTPTGTPQITDVAFSLALVEAITQSQIFASVVPAKDADYVLLVNLFGMDQPIFGGSFTVKMEAGWILRHAGSGATVWQEAIISESTATMGDAFSAVTRLRMATEGAAKKNIGLGLSKISKLDL